MSIGAGEVVWWKNGDRNLLTLFLKVIPTRSYGHKLYLQILLIYKSEKNLYYLYVTQMLIKGATLCNVAEKTDRISWHVIV